MEEWERQFKTFLTSGGGRSEVLKLLKEPDDSVFHSMNLNSRQLYTDSTSDVLPALLLNPESAFQRCDQMLVQAQLDVFNSSPDDDDEDGSSWLVKPKSRFRLSDLPQAYRSEFVRKTVPKSEDAGLFLSISGTVVRTVVPKMLEFAKLVQCSKCQHQFMAQGDYEQYYRLDMPASCPNPIQCDGKKFKAVAKEPIDLAFCRDYQEIKLQEQVGELDIGRMPASLWISLEDDLVDTCKPGDEITVNGIVKRRWDHLGRGHDGITDIELVLKANHVSVKNGNQNKKLLTPGQIVEFKRFWAENQEDPLKARNEILSAFCPQIYGLHVVKLALAVVLCGGVERVDESGTKVRGDSHALLLGDPGTGKSQLLRYAAKLMSRSVLTTGVGSTSAGLTCSAVREDGVWQLEAGALVLADGGVCCIDEFDTLKESDRTCIHEAMEQQSLSVAKAGIVCKLQTRCSVLAAANPHRKRRYDPSKPLTDNAAMDSPLLSRFDVVYVLLDSRNEEWDNLVASSLLAGRCLANTTRDLDDDETFWTMERLQSYFAYCRKNYNPVLGPDASRILSEFYLKQRRTANEADMARSTVRLLQSAIRLAQGHARLMCHDEVMVMDAIYAVLILNSCAESSRGGGNNGGNNPLHSTVPEEEAQEYMDNCESILSRLGLIDVWISEQAEMERLRRGFADFYEFEEEEMMMDDDEDDEGGQQHRGIDHTILTQVVPLLKSRTVLSYEDSSMRKERKKSLSEATGAAAGKKKGKGKGKSSRRRHLPSNDDDEMEEDFAKPRLEAVTSTQKNDEQVEEVQQQQQPEQSNNNSPQPGPSRRIFQHPMFSQLTTCFFQDDDDEDEEDYHYF